MEQNCNEVDMGVGFFYFVPVPCLILYRHDFSATQRKVLYILFIDITLELQ